MLHMANLIIFYINTLLIKIYEYFLFQNDIFNVLYIEKFNNLLVSFFFSWVLQVNSARYGSPLFMTSQSNPLQVTSVFYKLG